MTRTDVFPQGPPPGAQRLRRPVARPARAGVPVPSEKQGHRGTAPTLTGLGSGPQADPFTHIEASPQAPRWKAGPPAPQPGGAPEFWREPPSPLSPPAIAASTRLAGPLGARLRLLRSRFGPRGGHPTRCSGTHSGGRMDSGTWQKSASTSGCTVSTEGHGAPRRHAHTCAHSSGGSGDPAVPRTGPDKPHSGVARRLKKDRHPATCHHTGGAGPLCSVRQACHLRTNTGCLSPLHGGLGGSRLTDAETGWVAGASVCGGDRV